MTENQQGLRTRAAELWADTAKLWGIRSAMGNPTQLEIEVFDAERIFLNELPAWLYHVAHQLGKEVIRL